ncbi:carbohydrate porin, partial [filamentous cyanobacterium LEGE 11480]
MSSVTSVSQLSDVRPTDWAFQALQSLVERYGCIAGYPDKTYRGNRAMTRYEFAAGLNACMDRVNELIAAATNDMASKQDLATLQKLQEDFAAELAQLRGQVDAVEAKVATIEKQQFSTTTKLKGEVIFAVSGLLGGTDVAGTNRQAVRTGSPDATTDPIDDNTIFSNRARLNFDSSFTGKDRLRVRLQARNTPSFGGASGTNMARLGFDGDGGNNVEVSKLFYRFPVGKNLKFQVDAFAASFHNGLITPVTPFKSSGSGSTFRFGRFTPNIRPGAAEGAGLQARYKFNQQFALELGYLVDDDSNSPVDKAGIFDGNNKFIAQIVAKPVKNLTVAATYGRAYYQGGDVNVTGSMGSNFARRPFGSGTATRTNEFAGQLSYKLSKQLEVGGWYGVQLADQVIGSQDATVTNWMAWVAAKDFGKKGSRLGLQFGMPPKVTSVGGGLARAGRDDDTSYHLEATYKYNLNKKIAITPGLAVIFNPEHNSNNDTIFVGTIRTTFKF